MSTDQAEIIYGIHPVEQLLQTRINNIHRVLIVKSYGKHAFPILKQCRKNRIPYQLVPAQKIDQLCKTTKHQGVAAQCSIKSFDEAVELLNNAEKKKEKPLFIVAASIEDPRNLGAIVRSAVAFGANGLFLERKHSAQLNSTVSKASAGMLEHMPVARPRSLEKVLTGCRNNGYSIIGAVSGAQQTPENTDFTQPSILILGGEHRAIPPYLKSVCTQFVTIPTHPFVSSLNVSVAASILLYECAKQRAAQGGYYC